MLSHLIRNLAHLLFRAQSLAKLCLILAGLLCGASLHLRTINLWTLKNMSDSLLSRANVQRLIIIGAFHRLKYEQNVDGNFVIFQFVAESSRNYRIHCFSIDEQGELLITNALTQRIHQGKRGINNICSMSGYIAECQVATELPQSISIGTTENYSEAKRVIIEKQLITRRHDLVVCIAPTYALLEWRIMLLSIEIWLALGASKIIIPIQTISTDAFRILRAYEKTGIEESHVNCLHFVKPWANLVAFTDFDDLLLPKQPLDVQRDIHLSFLHKLVGQHPQAGSFLFEHQDVQLRLPDHVWALTRLGDFDFSFLQNTQTKAGCQFKRIKTRIIVNASRVDTVNMHEAGIHRLGYVQVRVPCRQAHFYHMRHSNNQSKYRQNIDMSNLVQLINSEFSKRLSTTLNGLTTMSLNSSIALLEVFNDFDQCVKEVTKEHFTFHVSRCMTPHTCFMKLSSDIDCVASVGSYEFVYASGDFVIALTEARFSRSDPNCEAPTSKFVGGNHFYAP